ncbi:MAG: hypothetical protein R6V75_11375 [Bacteroidales bacterium]
MMKRITPLLLLALIATGAYGQQYARGNMSMGFSVSLNSTRLVTDSVRYNSAILPGGGVDFFSSVNKWLKVNYGAQVSMKGTNDFGTLGNLRSFHLEPHLALQVSPAKIVRVEAGVQYSRMVAARTIAFSGDASSGKIWRDYKGLRSPMEYFVGLQADLGNRVFFGCRYYIPHTYTEFKRLEFRAIVMMIEGYSRAQ